MNSSGSLDRVLTARLECVRPAPEHADDLSTLLRDPRVAKTLFTTAVAPTEAEVVANLAAKQAHWQRYGFGLWMLYDRESGAWDFVALGLGDPYPVRSLHGRGTGDLLDEVVALLPVSLPEDEESGSALDAGEGRGRGDSIPGTPSVAIIGRPNVGKSSLVNRFVGAERVIVSEQAGTTRDAIDLPMSFEGRDLVLVDTAGLRRQSKVVQSLEYYTTLRSRSAAEQADVALVVCDATEGITAQDLRVAELAMKSGCATLLVLNKWDIADHVDLEHERAWLTRELHITQPRIVVTLGEDARAFLDSIVFPLAGPCTGAVGEITRWTPTIETLAVPAIGRHLGRLELGHDLRREGVHPGQRLQNRFQRALHLGKPPVQALERMLCQHSVALNRFELFDDLFPGVRGFQEPPCVHGQMLSQFLVIEQAKHRGGELRRFFRDQQMLAMD